MTTKNTPPTDRPLTAGDDDKLLHDSYIAMRDAMGIIDADAGPGRVHSNALNALADCRVRIENRTTAKARPATSAASEGALAALICAILEDEGGSGAPWSVIADRIAASVIDENHLAVSSWTVRAALERIAGEQQYRSGHCQTDITVEPALSADEAQSLARETLAASPPAREEAPELALEDAKAFGIGFIVDGQRVSPDRVTVCRGEEAPGEEAGDEPSPEEIEPFARQWCISNGIDPDEPTPPHGEWPRWYDEAGPFAAMWKTISAALRARTSEPAGVVSGTAQADMYTADLPVGTPLYTHPAPATADKLKVAKEAFDAITDLSVHLRQGGPDSGDLYDLSNGLEAAVDIAAKALATLNEEGRADDRGRIAAFLKERDEACGTIDATDEEREESAELIIALRTQAPDSWRPDREAVMTIIDANKYEPWTVDRAGQMADAILALRPQTAESGT